MVAAHRQIAGCLLTRAAFTDSGNTEWIIPVPAGKRLFFEGLGHLDSFRDKHSNISNVSGLFLERV